MPTWRDIRKTEDFRELDNVREMISIAIQSQYAASQSIVGIVQGFQEFLDPTEDINIFYNKVFNIMTAEGVSLDTWGRILGIDRTVADPDTGAAITLGDDNYRLMLLYRAMANIAGADMKSMNTLLQTLVNTGAGGFPAGKPAFVLESGKMMIRWVFHFNLDPVQMAIFRTAGTLARGAGVGWELYTIDVDNVFGFDGSGLKPFDQAPFIPDNSLITGE